VTDHDQLVVVRETLSSIYHLLMFVVAIQVVTFLLSLGKLWMMGNVRTELANATRESAQYRTLTQQYHDLYAKEGKEAQQVIVAAANVVRETVKAGGPLSDSGPQPVVKMTAEERAKAMERMRRPDPRDAT
jgi:hypothetical protein